MLLNHIVPMATLKNAGDAIQLHGGVGFTWEYDVHLYFKRAKSSQVFLGNGGVPSRAYRQHLVRLTAKHRFNDCEYTFMKLSFSEKDEAFRAEVAQWLNDNLVGEFAQLKFRGGPGDEHMFPEERKTMGNQTG